MPGTCTVLRHYILVLRAGQLEFAPFLVDHGADVNARDMYSFTPEHHE